MRSLLIRAGSLYAPIGLAVLLWWVRRPKLEERAGVLLASTWNASALLALNLLAARFGWWHFEASRGLFFGVPVDLYLGWIVLWGICPQLAFPRGPLAISIGFFAALDLLLMPRMEPVLRLGVRWWIGEAVALATCLIPSLLLGRLTSQQKQVGARAALQFVVFAGITLWLLPSTILAALGRHWPEMSAPWFFVGLQLVSFAGMPGVSAVQEFAIRGRGTPLPYDPPQKLVVTGPYAYVANPMQIAAALVLLAWGAILHNGWIAAAGIMAHIYSAGLARWDEGEDLASRFGQSWRAYRKEVHNWIPRWRPFVGGDAVLYVSETCGMCSQVKRWFERRSPTGLTIRPAEESEIALRRVTFVDSDGVTDNGVAAMARALERIHLGWAYLGWGMRLPIMQNILQLLVDASGGEPREIPSRASCKNYSAAG